MLRLVTATSGLHSPEDGGVDDQAEHPGDHAPDDGDDGDRLLRLAFLFGIRQIDAAKKHAPEAHQRNDRKNQSGDRQSGSLISLRSRLGGRNAICLNGSLASFDDPRHHALDMAAVLAGKKIVFSVINQVCTTARASHLSHPSFHLSLFYVKSTVP